MSKLSIAIIGAGIGGLAAAIALRQAGHDVRVFERTARFNRVGADINLTPNAVHALDKLGVGDILRRTAARPTHRISRDGITGEETSRLPMSTAAEEKYGAPQLTIHRADLLQALQDQLPAESIQLGSAVVSIDLAEDGASVVFETGDRETFDLVIGADGIHSAVRTALWGADTPEFTGLVSYRGVIPREKVEGAADIDAFTKWWGASKDKQIVVFPLTLGREIFVFATTPQEGWTEEGWTIPGDIDALRAMYADFHPDARLFLDACETVTASALHVRAPMAQWAKGRATLLGDAAHPMVPFMAQGACMAIEDAVVLGRALTDVDSRGLAAALASYEGERKPRTARIQESSLANEWLKKGSNADWVYAYDAWSVPLA
jgi:salicylate hydroxylase